MERSSLTRAALAVGLAALVGVAGFAAGRATRGESPGVGPAPVGAGNAWGQHVPRDVDASPASAYGDQARIRANVPTDFNPDIESPSVAATAYLDPAASVIGHVEIGARVYVAPHASLRGDVGQPIAVGADSNLQDGVVLHGLPTHAAGQALQGRTYRVGDRHYSVYIGERVSLGAQSQVHGPAWLEDDVFVGMQALVFRSRVGRGSVLEPGARVIGVQVAAERYVPAGTTVSTQAAADALPQIGITYAPREWNAASVATFTELAGAYSGAPPAAAAAEPPGAAGTR